MQMHAALFTMSLNSGHQVMLQPRTFTISLNKPTCNMCALPVYLFRERHVPRFCNHQRPQSHLMAQIETESDDLQLLTTLSEINKNWWSCMTFMDRKKIAVAGDNWICSKTWYKLEIAFCCFWQPFGLIHLRTARCDRAAAASVRKLVVDSFWRWPTQHRVATPRPTENLCMA